MKKMVKATCSLCGNEYERKAKDKYICPDCHEKIAVIQKIEKVDTAIRRLNKYRGCVSMYVDQVNMEPYANIVKDRIRNRIDRFSSLPEIFIAIQLQRQGIRYETQKQIGNCKVDFCLPDMEIVIEVDGSLYHTDEDKTFLRDRRIMANLDESWEIIHINAEDISDASWDLKGAIPYIISERNERYGFRNTYFDSVLLLEYTNFMADMRKGYKRRRRYAG